LIQARGFYKVCQKLLFQSKNLYFLAIFKGYNLKIIGFGTGFLGSLKNRKYINLNLGEEV
jgi:hypothetical protein